MALSQNLSFILLGEDKSASKTMTAAQETAARVTGAIGGSFSKLGGVIGGEFGSILGEVGSGVDELGAKHLSLARGLQIGGGAATVAGLALMNMASGEKQATDQLSAAITASGGSMSDYTDQIEKTVQSGQNFRHDSEDTKNALAKMVEATGSTEEALKRMGVVTDLAAAKHLSLADAATMVDKIMGGKGGRTLAEYGITMTKNADGTKNVQKALDELQAKLSGQASASVNNFAAQVDIARIKATDWAKTIAGPLGQALTATGPLVAGLGIVLDIYRARKVAAAAAEGAATVALMANSAAMGGAAAATTAATVATEGETVAQTGLNAAMDANPIGLVVGALGLLAGLVAGGVIAGNIAGMAQATTDYTGTLDVNTGAITDNTRAQVAKSLLDSGALAAAQAAGISTQKLVDATLGNVDAQKQITDQITSGIAAIDAQGMAVDQLTGGTKGLTGAQEAQRAKLVAVGDAFVAQRDAVKDSIAKNDLLKGSLADTSTSLDAARQSATDYAYALRNIPSSVSTSVSTSVGRYSGGGRPFASGGIVTSPTRGIVGESGPEAVIPLNGGRLPMMGGGGGSTVVNVTVQGMIVGTANDMAKQILTSLTNAKRVGAISGAEFGRLAI